MTTQQARCAHDQPSTTDRCRKMGRKPHDAGRCGVRGWLEPLGACRVRRNGRSSALGNGPSGESRLTGIKPMFCDRRHSIALLYPRIGRCTP